MTSMISSMVKKQVEYLLQEYAHPGYGIEFTLSGIELCNLELKVDVLLPTSLPFYAVSGVIENVTLNIPYTSLGSKPMDAIIDNVVFLVKMKNTQNWNAKDELEAYGVEKKRATDCEWNEDAMQMKFEEFVQMYFGEEGGYKAQIGKVFKRALNNVNVEVNQVHVRYEEESMVENKKVCHSIGATVEKIVSFATNGDFEQDGFLEQLSGELHRVVEVDQVGIYCDMDGQCILPAKDMNGRKLNIKVEELFQRFNRMESHASATSSHSLQWWDASKRSKTHHYVIAPLRDIRFQLTTTLGDAGGNSSAQASIGRPKSLFGSMTCHMECGPVAVAIDTEQTIVLLNLGNQLNQYTNWQSEIRKQEYNRRIESLSEQDIRNFERLVSKKMHRKKHMTKEEHDELQQLQLKSSLHSLACLRRSGVTDLDASLGSPVKQEMVSVEFVDGPLGLDIEVNAVKYGHHGVRVNECIAGGQAANSGKIKAGYIISAVGNVQVDVQSYEQVLELLSATQRPVMVQFCTLPKHSMISHFELDENRPDQLLTFTASIHSYSIAFVAAKVRREIIRVIGSECQLNMVAKFSSKGALYSVDGNLTTQSIELNDRWNIGNLMQSTSYVAACTPFESDAGIHIEFHVNISNEAVEQETKSRAMLTIGNIDVNIIAEYVRQVLGLYQAQIEEIITGVKSIQPEEPYTVSTITSIRESTLEIEILPPSLGTVLCNALVLPATFDNAILSQLQFATEIRFFVGSLTTMEQLQIAGFLNACAARDVKFNGFLAQNGSLEHSVRAFTLWNQAPGCVDQHLVSGFMPQGHTVGSCFDEEKKFIQSQNEDSTPQLNCALQSTEQVGVLKLSGKASIRDTEVQTTSSTLAFKAMLKHLTPCSVYLSMLPVQTSKGLHSVMDKETIITDVFAECTRVSDIIKDIDTSSEDQQLFGYQATSSVHYTFNCENGEESVEVAVKSLACGVYNLRGDLASNKTTDDGGILAVCKRTVNESNAYQTCFGVKRATLPYESELTTTCNKSRGCWRQIPASVTIALFDQLNNDVQYRWPRNSNDGSLISIQDMLADSLSLQYNSSNTQSDELINSAAINRAMRTVSNLLPTLQIQSSSRGSLLTDNVESFNWCREIMNRLKVTNLSYTARKKAVYVPSGVTAPRELNVAATRGDVAECNFFEHASENLYWSNADVNMLASKNGSALRKLSFTNCNWENVTADFAQMNSVTEVAFVNCKISDRTFNQFLLSVPNIQCLTLKDVSTLEEIDMMCPHLVRLSIVGCIKIDDSALTMALAKSTKLQYLDLSECIQLKDISMKLPHLTQLNLSLCTRLSDGTVSNFCENCPRLRVLDLTWCYQLKTPSLIAKELVELSLYRCVSLTDTTINTCLLENTHLKSINLSGTRRMGERKGYDVPEPLTDYLTTWFNAWQRRRRGPPEIEPRWNAISSSVKELILEDSTAVVDDDVTLICTRNTNMEVLNLDGCTMLENPVIASNSLKSISMKHCTSLSTHAIEVMITHCPSLERINIQGCGSVDVRGLQLKSTQYINVLGCNVPQPVLANLGTDGVQIKIAH